MLRTGTFLGVIGLLAVLATSSVLADSTSGVHGRYAISDTSGHPGVTCNYTPDFPNHYLVSFSVKSPRVWWPNTTSADSREHGTVGWWPSVQRNTGSGWHTVTSGPHQVATAYEDHPKGDPADSAAFSNETVPWSASDQEAYRVVLRVVWYSAGSAVMGQAKHVVKHYRSAFPLSNGGNGSCAGRLTILG